MLNAVGHINATTQHVTQAIKQASAHAGVDFAYLLNKASQESSLNPSAKSAHSTATGLFQFVEQTWLRTVKTYGAKYGMEVAANNISIGPDGVARVKDPAAKQAILDLRKNPVASAGMAAELTNENKTALQAEVGGAIGPTELYLAHFLGAGGATEFLNTMRSHPDTKAASVLPQAAASNHSVFFDKSGQPRSLSQIYQHFAQKFDGVAAPATTMVADATPSTVPLLNLPVQSVGTGLPSSRFAVAGITSSLPSAMSSFKPDNAMSAPFATMVLAQMNMGDLSPLSSSGTVKHDDEQKKKSVISGLNLAA